MGPALPRPAGPVTLESDWSKLRSQNGIELLSPPRRLTEPEDDDIDDGDGDYDDEHDYDDDDCV